VIFEYWYSDGVDRLKGDPPLIATSNASRIPHNSASKTSFVCPRGRPFLCHLRSISQAMPAPTSPDSSFDPSDHSTKFDLVLYALRALFSAVSFRLITIFPGNRSSLGYIALLKPSEGSIARPSVRFFTNLCPSPFRFKPGSVY
jgi:hypothetical protein